MKIIKVPAVIVFLSVLTHWAAGGTELYIDMQPHIEVHANGDQIVDSSEYTMNGTPTFEGYRFTVLR
jgi:hypothetical protein